MIACGVGKSDTEETVISYIFLTGQMCRWRPGGAWGTLVVGAAAVGFFGFEVFYSRVIFSIIVNIKCFIKIMMDKD